jgi:hypothetical protein
VKTNYEEARNAGMDSNSDDFGLVLSCIPGFLMSGLSHF